MVKQKAISQGLVSRNTTVLPTAHFLNVKRNVGKKYPFLSTIFSIIHVGAFVKCFPPKFSKKSQKKFPPLPTKKTNNEAFSLLIIRYSLFIIRFDLLTVFHRGHYVAETALQGREDRDPDRHHDRPVEPFRSETLVEREIQAPRRARDALEAHLLPETENYILSADDANEIKLQIQKLERSQKYYLTDLIKKACTKYRLSKSSSETLGLVESQVDIYNAEIESEQSFINYIAWAIPSVGFIGTVLGISASLGYANEATTPEGIEKVTSALSVAFDTTLIALVLSIILMLMIHALYKQQEELFTNMKSYMIENLINRLYK